MRGPVRLVHRISAGVLALAAIVSAAVAAPDSSIVRLSSARLQIGFDGRDGSLREIYDPATDHHHVRPAATQAGLWTIRARAGDEKLILTPGRARSFRSERLGDRPALRLVWDGFQVPAAPELRIEAAVRLDNDAPMSAWELVVHKPGKLMIEEIVFPVVAGIAPQEDEYLAVPHWMGEQAANPRRLLSGADGKGRRLEWPYPGHLSMQCLAYYRKDGPGLYAACDDTAARRKRFALWGDEKAGVHFEIVHHPESAAGAGDEQTLGYRVLLGTFRGDWFTAAERYRSWATRQTWARESRLRKGQVPDWIVQTGLWVWNRGRSPQVLLPAVALQKDLGLPVSVFWHWWHGCPYDAGFPEYLPPREGADAFRAALAQAHRDGIHALVYMNQRLWGMTTRSWAEEGAAAFAVKGADGAIHPEVYNTFTRQPCASMCMGTAFWRAKYAGLAEKAFHELGVDGIYMDQACSSLPCYDRSHGHAMGRGSYWMEGFRMLAEDVRRRCDAPRRIALAGEGCGEPWLPHLDLMLTLQVSRERYAAIADGWEVIPLFHAVYHPYAVLYGNYSSLTAPPYDDLWPAEHAPKQPLALLDRKYSRQFYLEQARAFVWGQQPTIANFLDSQRKDRAEEIGYASRLAKTRSRGAKYLLHGTFLRPPSLGAPEILLDMSRLSIYAGQGDRVKSFRKTCPSALAGAWLAPDGDVGIALASIADEPITLSVGLNPEEHKLPRSGRVYRIDEAGRSSLGSFDREHPCWTLRLPPRGAWILEIAP